MNTASKMTSCIAEQCLSLMKNMGLNFKCGNKEDWDRLLSITDYCPAYYAFRNIEYQQEYIKCGGANVIDLSLIIYIDNKPIALWPLSLIIIDGKNTIGSLEGDIVAPLFISGTTHNTKKKISQLLIKIVQEISAQLTSLTVINLREFYTPGEFLTEWHEQCMPLGSALNAKHDLFVNLKAPLDNIRAHFRKSYKPLINQAKKLWHADILRNHDSKIWDEFRLLHIKVSGRETRSINTWEIQHAMLSEGNGFLVYLRDDNGRMVGGGFFMHTHNEGLYAVAAYDRSLFDKPLGHLVQSVAIEEMIRIGLNWYRIGARPYLCDTGTISKKEFSIAEFKQGFATHSCLQLNISIPIKHNSANPTDTLDKF